MKKLLMALMWFGVSTACVAQTIRPSQITPSTEAGDVITTVTPGQPPSWQPASGGSGGSLSSSIAALHAGDSLTWGYASTGGIFSSFPYWLDKAAKIPAANQLNIAIPGQTVQLQDQPVLNTPFIYSKTQLITEQIGTNNLLCGTSTACVQSYGQDLASHILWWMTPATSKFTFRAASNVTYTGTWVPSGTYVGSAAQANGSTASFSVTGRYLHIVTAGIASSTGVGNYSCDGGSTTGALSLVFTATGGGAAQGMQDNPVDLGGTSTTTHSCVITATTAGATTTSQMGIEFIATLSGASNTTSPFLEEGQIPDQLPQDTTNTPAYRAQQAATVAALQAQGLANLVFVPTTGATPTNTYVGQLHVTGLGYWYLAQPYIAAYNTFYGTSFTEPAFTQGGVELVANQAAGTQADTLCEAYGACAFLSTGGFDTAIGVYGLHSTTNATYSTTLGWSALGACNGACNEAVAIGSNALQTATSALDMTVVGRSAGWTDPAGVLIPNTTDSNGTLVGHQTGKTTNTVLSQDWGAFGNNARVNQDNSYEIGAGSNITPNTLAFRSFPISDTLGRHISGTGGPITGVSIINYMASSEANFIAGTSVVTVTQTNSTNDAKLTVSAVVNGVPTFANTGAAGSGYGANGFQNYTLLCISGTCAGTPMVVNFINQTSGGGCNYGAGGPLFNIVTLGTGFTAGDSYTLTGGPGSGCIFTVASIRNGVPSGLTITTPGTTYIGNATAQGTPFSGGGTGTLLYTITSVNTDSGQFCFGSLSFDCFSSTGQGINMTSAAGNAVLNLLSQGTTTTVFPAGTVGLSVPNSGITPYRLILPGVGPTSGNTYLSCTVPSSNLSTCSWVAGGGGGGSLPTCTLGQMLYYAATGATATCLTVGSGLNITSGTITSTGGAVSSVFGRTGAVVAASGDYTVSQVTGAVSAIGVTTANGVSGSSSGGTTPNLTIALGAITPTSVAASGAISGSTVNSGSGATGCGSATGCLAMAEASTAGTPTAGMDYIRADSTSHTLKCSYNGAAEVACNSGGGLSGLTTGVIPVATSSTAIGNSQVDEGITTANRVTVGNTDSAGVGALIFSGTDVTHDQYSEYLYTGTIPTVGVAAHSVRQEALSDPGASGSIQDIMNPTPFSIAGQGTATFATGAGAGTTPGTPTCTTSHVCDSLSGTVSLTTGTATPTTGILLTVTTTTTRTNLPNCSVFLNLAASPFTAVQVYPSYTTTTVVFNMTGTAATASTAYVLRYMCEGI